jgi:predicted RNase H-like HicB family nuclease
MATFIALLRKDKGSDYGVDFPDFPGCVTAGATLEEARRMAAEALELHIEGMTEDGMPLPAPASLDTIMTDPENADAVAFLVDVPATTSRAMRINVTLPADLVQAIDRQSRNRSGFLADAAREKLREMTH